MRRQPAGWRRSRGGASAFLEASPCRARASRRLSRHPSSARRGLLFHCNTLGEISRLVDIAAAAYSDVIGEQLKRNHFEDRK